jgi:kynurenine formamidase
VTIIDLSVPIDSAVWEPNPVKMRLIDHKAGGDLLGMGLLLSEGKAKTVASFIYKWARAKLGLGVSHRDFPDKKGLSVMHVTLTTHTGTHMDSPFHYGDVSANGDKARMIAEVPLEWCYSDGIVLDVSNGPQDEPVTKDEVVAALSRILYTLKPYDIVLMKTGGDKYLGQKKYYSHFRGVTRDATEHLVQQGVKVIGIDSFGFDMPFHKMLDRYKTTANNCHLWPAHIYGREQEYCQLERLTNLDKLPSGGFKVACFPVRLEHADAAWCRVVAII